MPYLGHRGEDPATCKAMTSFTRQNPPTGFYTYAYLREDGRPYYIGKGRNRRAWDRHRNKGRWWQPPYDDRILFLKWGLTEEQAHAHEIYMISVYGNHYVEGGWLTLNFTDGGEGIVGYVCTEEDKKKMSASAKNRNLTPEARKKVLATLLEAARKPRKPLSEEHKKKLSAAKTGQSTPAMRAAAKKTGAARVGTKMPEDAKKKISKALTGLKRSEELKRKMSQLASERPESHKAAIKESRQRATAQKYQVPEDWYLALSPREQRKLCSRFCVGFRGEKLVQGMPPFAAA